MIIRFLLAVVVLIIVLLAMLALRYPGHTAITFNLIYDVIIPAPSMDFAAIGIDPNRVSGPDTESRAYLRGALLEKFPVGTDYQYAEKKFLDAGVVCEENDYALSEDHFEIRLPEEEKGPVYRCSGEYGGGRVVSCLLFFDVQTDSAAKIRDYWVNFGCTGP